MLGYLAGLKTTPILYNCQGQTLFWPRPAHNEYWKWYHAAPPPDGQWARPEP